MQVDWLKKHANQAWSIDITYIPEYSCAAEPPVQYRLSHLSRRSEPLINYTICYDAGLLA